MCSLNKLCLLCHSSLAMREASDTLLVNYLGTIGGDLPWIEPLPDLASKLPPFLKQRYRISRVDLFGRKYLLAMLARSKNGLLQTSSSSYRIFLLMSETA
jgi:hypothetical protein